MSSGNSSQKLKSFNRLAHRFFRRNAYVYGAQFMIEYFLANKKDRLSANKCDKYQERILLAVQRNESVIIVSVSIDISRFNCCVEVASTFAIGFNLQYSLSIY